MSQILNTYIGKFYHFLDSELTTLEFVDIEVIGHFMETTRQRIETVVKNLITKYQGNLRSMAAADMEAFLKREETTAEKFCGGSLVDSIAEIQKVLARAANSFRYQAGRGSVPESIGEMLRDIHEKLEATKEKAAAKDAIDWPELDQSNKRNIAKIKRLLKRNAEQIDETIKKIEEAKKVSQDILKLKFTI